MIKSMAKAASAKRPRKKGAAGAAASTGATKKQGGDSNVRGGDGSSNISKGPSRQTASALATAAAVTLSSSAGAAKASRSHAATTGHGYPLGSPNASPAPSLIVSAEPGAGKRATPSALESGGRVPPKKTQSAAVSAVAGADRSPAAVVSAPASSNLTSEAKNDHGVAAATASDRGTVASEGTAVPTPDGSNGGKPVSTKVPPVATPVATPVGGGSPGKEGTLSSAKRAGTHGRGQERTPPPPQSPPASALSPAASPGHQTVPSGTPIGGEPGRGWEGGRSNTERAKRPPSKESATPTAMALNPRSTEGGDREENKHSGDSVGREVKTVGGADKNGGESAMRDGGSDGPLTPVASEERDDASAHFFLSEVWNTWASWSKAPSRPWLPRSVGNMPVFVNLVCFSGRVRSF